MSVSILIMPTLRAGVVLLFLFFDVQLSFATDATASNGVSPLAGTANSGRQTEFLGLGVIAFYCHFPLLLILLRRGFYRTPKDFAQD